MLEFGSFQLLNASNIFASEYWFCNFKSFGGLVRPSGHHRRIFFLLLSKIQPVL